MLLIRPVLCMCCMCWCTDVPKPVLLVIRSSVYFMLRHLWVTLKSCNLIQLPNFLTEYHTIKKIQLNFGPSIYPWVICDRRDSFRELGLIKGLLFCPERGSGNPLKVQHYGDFEWSCLT